jgi:hypothetical protein
MNRQIDRNLTITDGRFENWLLDRLFIRGELPPGTFVAVGGLDPDVVPVADAEPIASVRYVMGALP